jgi:hypothetical protein
MFRAKPIPVHRIWITFSWLIGITFLLQPNSFLHAQVTDANSVDSRLERWREIGKSNATKANAIASLLSPAQRQQARSLFADAFELNTEGNTEAARIAFERGLAIDPSSGQAEYYLAEALVRLNEPEKALPHYANAMTLAPNAMEGIKAEAALHQAVSVSLRNEAAARMAKDVEARRAAAKTAQAARDAEATQQAAIASQAAREAEANQAAANAVQAARDQEAKQAAAKAAQAANAERLAKSLELLKEANENIARTRAMRNLKCTGTIIAYFPGIFGKKEIPTENFVTNYIWDPTRREINGKPVTIIGSSMTYNYELIIDGKVFTHRTETFDLQATEVSSVILNPSSNINQRFEGKCESSPSAPSLQ